MKKNEITPLQPIPERVQEEQHDHGSIRDLHEVEIVRLSDEELEEMHERARAVAKRRAIARNVTTKFWTALGTILAIAVAAFALMPIVLTILDSFMSTDEIKTNYSAVYNSLSSAAAETKTYLSSTPKLKMIPDMVSFSQYKTLLFLSPTYLLKFWNSVALVVPIVLGQLMVGCLAAYSFSRYRRKRREVLFFSYVILMLMPFQVTLVPNYLIANHLGIYNTRQIPSSYIEAAKLDGANEWNIFTRISLPMCKSAIYAMAILLFIDYWNMVEQPLILLENESKQPLSVFLSQINASEIGVAFAASFIFMLPPLLIFLYGEQYLVEGISRSGIK